MFALGSSPSSRVHQGPLYRPGSPLTHVDWLSLRKGARTESLIWVQAIAYFWDKQWAITHRVATQNTSSVVPMALQRFTSAVAHNPRQQHFGSIFSRGQARAKRGGGAVRTHRVRCRVSSRSAVPAAYYPWTGPARWLRAQSSASTGTLAMPKGLASAPKDSTLRMGGPARPGSCRAIFFYNLCEHPHSLACASVPAATHHLRSWSERWSWSRPLDLPSVRALVPRRVGSTGPMSDGAHAMLQDAQKVSGTQGQIAATRKGSNLRSCSSSA